jgi:hypothetical protein
LPGEFGQPQSCSQPQGEQTLPKGRIWLLVQALQAQGGIMVPWQNAHGRDVLATPAAKKHQ